MVKMGRGLQLPGDAATQVYAFLARRGAGKTYAAGKLAEGLLEAGVQVVVIDPVGVWYGLRLSANGKDKGFDIPVFGGRHGDVPLNPQAGELVAEVIVEKGLSAVIDVSEMRKAERRRFVTDLAEQLFHLQKKGRHPLHLVLEEAQVFVPQRAPSGEERMLGAFEDLVRLGRNFGIGCSMVSQRPQSVNKEVLNQAECLFVMQTSGPQERKALEGWIVDKGLDVRELVGELPSLPIGTAFVWSPQWLGLTRKVAIGKKQTYDASATPSVGKRAAVEPRSLAKAELQALEASFAEMVEEAKANDPKALRAQVRALEARLKAAEAKVETKEVEVSVLTDEDRDLLAVVRTGFGAMETMFESVGSNLDHIRGLLEKLEGAAERLNAPQAPPAASPGRSPVPRKQRAGRASRTPQAPSEPHRVGKDAGKPLKAGARRMLAALKALGGSGDRAQVAMLAGMSPKSGTFTDYLSSLRTGEFVEVSGQALSLTGHGERYISGEAVRVPTTTREVVALWAPKLKAGARRMLEALVEHRGEFVSREDLGDAVGMSPTSGTFTDYLSSLNRAGLLKKEGAWVAASDALFPG